MRTILGFKTIALGLWLGAALSVAVPSDVGAAIVLCKKGKTVRLRETACKGKETSIPASELGVTGPQGSPGPPHV